MTVVIANWNDLGYQKLGPSRRLNAEKTKVQAEVLSRSGFHEIQTDGDARWVREKARRRGIQRPSLLCHDVTIDRLNYSNEANYQFAIRARVSPYAEQQRRVVAPVDTLISISRDIVGQNERWKAVHALSLSVSLCNPDNLEDILLHHVLPTFFQAYPDGRLVVFNTDYDFEKRYGLVRGGYAFSNYERSDLDMNRGFETLRNWQMIDTLNPPRTVGDLLAFAFYPYVHVVVTGPIGLKFFFLLDPPDVHSPPIFPASWLSFPQSHWDFGEEQREHLAVLTGANQELQDQAAHKRFRHQRRFNSREMTDLLTWAVERYNELAYHVADPCEFLDHDGCIDFVLAYEYGITLDRVLRKALSCISSEETVVRKAAAMEIADLIESLRTVWDLSSGNTVFFKQLCHPIVGCCLVKRCLISMPEPFRTYFLGITDALYNELELTIRNSIWVTSKITSTGVLVKDRNLAMETEEPFAEFTSNVLRALRNAHHGYMTRIDPRNRPSRYLALVNGNTPDSFAYLGYLWVLALLASPQEMLAWNWMPTAAWD